MTPDDATSSFITPFDEQTSSLETIPPFIWPEPRINAGLACYGEIPPRRELFAEANLLSALLVGASNGTLQWLEELMLAPSKRKIVLVLALFPAGPTREEHLKALLHLLQTSEKQSESALEVRLLLMDFDLTLLPPTVILAHNSHTGRTVMSIGSVGDAGNDQALLGSFNLVFEPDALTRDEWRRWFAYLRSSAHALTAESVHIPYLIPAKGDPEAGRLWREFGLICRGESTDSTGPTVDPETGEVTHEIGGDPVRPWDGGELALDAIAQEVQRIYVDGRLVTVDETTRIKPLRIPVTATLFDQLPSQTIGALTQRQAFTLKILEDTADRELEKCRNVSDAIALLSCPLSKGSRWMPKTARELLEKEIEARNELGQKILMEALGGSVDQFIAKRTESIRRDLNWMYHQLSAEGTVPLDRFTEVLKDVKKRLEDALSNRITPSITYNRIEAPDLTHEAPDQNWNQPLLLLERTARVLRELLIGNFRSSSLMLPLSLDDFHNVYDLFGDSIVVKPNSERAECELHAIDEIITAESTAKEKVSELWRLIKGEQAAS